jgi:hypothetical protein
LDKKQLTGIVDGLVAKVASANGLEEAEARTLVGIALRKNAEVLVQAIVNPTLSLSPGA